MNVHTATYSQTRGNYLVLFAEGKKKERASANYEKILTFSLSSPVISFLSLFSFSLSSLFLSFFTLSSLVLSFLFLSFLSLSFLSFSFSFFPFLSSCLFALLIDCRQSTRSGTSERLLNTHKDRYDPERKKGSKDKLAHDLLFTFLP